MEERKEKSVPGRGNARCEGSVVSGGCAMEELKDFKKAPMAITEKRE